MPVEATEAVAPIVIWRKELRQDSGGAGRQRGGLGQVMEIGSREDAPFGLYPTVLLGRLCGCPAPLHEAGLLTLSALYGRDLAAENDVMPALGLADLSVGDLRRLAGEGVIDR